MSTLDHNNLKNYCTVSNLSFLSRVIEKIIMWQLFAYLSSHDLLCPSQSAYRPCCSTDMTLPKRTREILLALDGGDVFWSVLCFTTISEPVPPYSPPLTSIYGISGTILSWFESYLTSRTQTVTVNGQSSRPGDVFFGVTLGTVLGPILFILYSAPLCSLTEIHSVSKQSFPDDTQLLQSCPADQVHTTVLIMQTCISEVKTWITKQAETEWWQEGLSSWSQIEPFFLMLSPLLFMLAMLAFHSQPACILGFMISDNVTLDKQISTVWRSAYVEIGCITSIHQCLTVEATQTLICAFVFSIIQVRLL